MFIYQLYSLSVHTSKMKVRHSYVSGEISYRKYPHLILKEYFPDVKCIR